MFIFQNDLRQCNCNTNYGIISVIVLRLKDIFLFKFLLIGWLLLIGALQRIDHLIHTAVASFVFASISSKN